jgi:hypothetical protein
MTLTKFPTDQYLDLPRYRGQRTERFRYEWKNGITNETLGWLTPKKESPPQLVHDSSRSIKRSLTLSLGVTDTARINSLTDRVLPYVEIGGTAYPLGRFMFTDDLSQMSTGGDQGSYTLLDEGFIIDQPIERGVTPLGGVDTTIISMLKGLPILTPRIEASSYDAMGGFAAGQTRGQIINTYSFQGDYFPYWMNNDGQFNLVRTFDPAGEIPDFDFDSNHKVMRNDIARSSTILTATNRFIVVSTASDEAPVYGIYDVPPSAPHSQANRGFYIIEHKSVQLASNSQANAVARSFGLQQTIYERITLNTAIDPRHDSYNVIRFDGSNWLELAWSMELRPGGAMQHTMRKAYA